MEDYLLDRETLMQFIDSLMKKRTLPVNSAEELAKYREEQMHALDDYVSQAIFGSLDSAQTAALSDLLNRESENPDVFRDFFEHENINLELIITGAFESFGKNFLAGGQNG
ncbi:hypothetical protein IKG60_00450 [Candidatus Saccharibacteria bacterium]|nr:hypothetical protein [Candidatus Saccharibacteria bacterium]